MAISRAQLAKELEPGLNALFGLEYDRYENEHAEIFEEEASDRAFEEEVMLGGFSTAPVKNEGGAISFDDAQETYTARYTHETIALAFSITEEAIEDNLYDRLASRYTKALARSMAQTKQIKAAGILNNAFSTSSPIGDGAALCSSAHPSISGNQRNQLATAADLNETSLEQMLIDVAGLTDERGLKIAVVGRSSLFQKSFSLLQSVLLTATCVAGRLTMTSTRSALWACFQKVRWSITSSPTRTRSLLKQMRRMVLNSSTVRRLKPPWKATSTRVTCASKRVSVIRSAFPTGAAYLERLALHKLRGSFYNGRAAIAAPFVLVYIFFVPDGA